MGITTSATRVTVAGILIWGATGRGLWAQATQSDQGEQSEASGLAEIIVTAQRREESLQKVPISVQAASAEEINRDALNDTKSLTELFPTLNYSESSSAGGSGFALRGVQSTTEESGVQPSSALVIDGVPVMRQAEFIHDLTDIDRIEVLNGPQGTLFGKNSTAGVINILTKNPTNDYEARVEGGATNDREYIGRAMFNAPLTEGVQVRANVFYRNQQGIIPNVYPGGQSAGSVETWGAQAKVKVSVGEQGSVLLSSVFSRVDSTYDQLVVLQPSEFPGFAQAYGQPLGFGVTPRVNADSPGIDLMRTWGVTAEFKWDFNEQLHLVSIMGYRSLYEDYNGNFDGLPVGGNVGVGLSPNPTGYPVGYYDVGLPRAPDRENYGSEEIRLSYNGGPVNAIGGIFYQAARNDFDDNFGYYLDGSLVGGTIGTDYESISPTKSLVHDKTASVFGDVTYAIRDPLSAFAGIRLTRETLDIRYDRNDYLAQFGNGFDPITGIITAAPIDDGLHFYSSRAYKNLSGRAGLQWQPAANLNYYVSYARGYKGPGTNQASSLVSEQFVFVKPEIADAYEIGAKLKLFGDRLALNTDVFYQTIANIQEDALPPGQTIENQLVNAGTLITRGFEGTYQAAVLPHTVLAGGVVYTKADYHGFRFGCNSAQTPGMGSCAADGTQSTDGEPAVGSPRWKLTTNLSYADQFARGQLGYFVHLGYVWVSAIQYSIGADPLTLQPSHGLLDATLGVKSNDGHWTAQIYGKNLTQQLYYSSLLTAPFLSRQFAYMNRDYLRYGGITIAYKF